MKHFTAEECIDFVNQLVSSSREAEMAEHLNTGCERCAKAVSSWQRIRRAVAAEATYQPPKEAIRIAKAAFAGSEWARRRKPAKRAMEVLFDSFLRPAAAGIRSSAGAVSGSRRMLYRADPFRIDLQIEAQVSGKRIVVTGQLLDLRSPEAAGGEVPVLVSNMRGRVVQGKTNQFGEFREEIESSGDLELVFVGADDRPVTISLPGVLAQPPDTRR